MNKTRARRATNTTLRTSANVVRGALTSLRAGRAVVLVGDVDEWNGEGAIVSAGALITPDTINFMVTHGRGNICATVDRLRASHLELEPQRRHNATAHRAQFLCLIEAASGVTTGISAADRARTVAVLCDPSSQPRDLVSPGHVLPVVVRDGGVLVSAGAEAPSDLTLLAGLGSCAAYCKILREDGHAATETDLLDFSRRFDLNVVSVRDIICFRAQHRPLVSKIADVAPDVHLYWSRTTSNEYLFVCYGTCGKAPTLVEIKREASLLGALNGATRRAANCSSDRGGLMISFSARPANRSYFETHSPSLTREEVMDVGQILLDLGISSIALGNMNAAPDFGRLRISTTSLSSEGTSPDDPCNSLTA